MSSARPERDLAGTTRDVLVPGADGAVTVTVTINRLVDGAPAEVFVSGVPGDRRALVNALCRTVSTALRHGVPVDRVAHMLRGQSEDAPPVWWPGKPGVVTSIPDALGRLLEATLTQQAAGPVCRCGQPLDHGGPCR